MIVKEELFNHNSGWYVYYQGRKIFPKLKTVKINTMSAQTIITLGTKTTHCQPTSSMEWGDVSQLARLVIKFVMLLF